MRVIALLNFHFGKKLVLAFGAYVFCPISGIFFVVAFWHDCSSA